jgi:hypothetical protein
VPDELAAKTIDPARDDSEQPTLPHSFSKENKGMRTRLMMIVTAILVVAALAIGALGGARKLQAESDFPDMGITGSWQLEVTVQTPPNTPPFSVLVTFIPGGGLITTRAGYIPSSPAGPVLESTGHGAWLHLHDDEYSVSAIDMMQGAPGNTLLNGAPWANENLRFYPILSRDGNHFTGQWTSTFTDPNGNFLFAAGGTLKATRIAVEH